MTDHIRNRKLLRVPMAGKKVFTTGEIAALLSVASRTVSKWFDSGKLKGYRIPLAQDRRIPRASLIRFFREQGIPLPAGLDDPHVLLCTADALLVDHLSGALPGLILDHARSGFECGTLVSAHSPMVAVIDCAVTGQGELPVIAGVLHLHEASVILLAPEDGLILPAPAGVEVFARPFDPVLLAESILTHLGGQS